MDSTERANIFIFGAVAQLGERRVRNAKVRSSILLGSTIIRVPEVRGRSELPRAVTILSQTFVEQTLVLR